MIELLKKYGVHHYTINNDGSVNILQDLNLSGLQLTKLPFVISYVKGNLDISNNQLDSLVGCPEITKRS